jgi:hypothetical protein
MKPLEVHLRQALQRVSPPEDFAQRVLHELAAGEARPGSVLPARRRGWFAAAATLLLLSGGGFLEHQRRQQVKGERARAQLLLALQITSHKLNTTLQRIPTEKENP